VWDNNQRGINAVYGSVDNDEIWKKVRIENATVLVLAIPRTKKALPLLLYARKVNPKIAIFGRARYFSEALTLYEHGVDFVIMPHVVGSNVFVEKVGEYLRTGNMDEIRNLNTEFIEYLREKAKRETVRFID
ncbi:MAG: NAD-binding protein, partial [archaeon]|nr:NAD-binding protein [archaeon]